MAFLNFYLWYFDYAVWKETTISFSTTGQHWYLTVQFPFRWQCPSYLASCELYKSQCGLYSKQTTGEVDFPKNWERVGAVSDLRSCPPAHTTSPKQHDLQNVSIAFAPRTWCAEINPSEKWSAANLNVDMSDTTDGTADHPCEGHRDEDTWSWMNSQCRSEIP